MRRFHFNERPDSFEIDPQHPLAQGLVLAGLGRCNGGLHYHDSSLYGNHGVLTNMNPATDWNRSLSRPSLSSTGSGHVYCGSTLYTASQVKTTGLTHCGWAYFPPPSTTLVGGITSCKGIPTHSQPTAGSIELVRGTGAVAARAKIYDGSYTYVEDAFTEGYNEFHHIALVLSPAESVISVWRNGVFRHSTVVNVAGIIFDAAYNYIGALKTYGDAVAWPYPWCDSMIWSRVLSPGEISALADPSNVMLSLGGSDPGLIVPDDLVYPVYLPSSVPAGAKPALWLGVCA